MTTATVEAFIPRHRLLTTRTLSTRVRRRRHHQKKKKKNGGKLGIASKKLELVKTPGNFLVAVTVSFSSPLPIAPASCHPPLAFLAAAINTTETSGGISCSIRANPALPPLCFRRRGVAYAPDDSTESFQQESKPAVLFFIPPNRLPPPPPQPTHLARLDACVRTCNASEGLIGGGAEKTDGCSLQMGGVLTPCGGLPASEGQGYATRRSRVSGGARSGRSEVLALRRFTGESGRFCSERLGLN